MLRAVALMGPTGAGKSTLALALARETGATIICCDSMQVYRGLDIGTAKPSREERDTVPHALVDCCTLPDVFSAARWAASARAVIEGENAAGRTPLIVGGTGLYLRALIEPLADIPPEAPQVRARLQARLDAGGVEALHAELARVDEITARRLHPADTQRIMRALAVHASTGRPLSAWLRRAGANPAASPARCSCSIFRPRSCAGRSPGASTP
jgi:tRNA dimethylallyltransferase